MLNCEINWEIILALLAFLTSCCAVRYAQKSATEAMKSNDIGHLNALFAFREHYLTRMQNEADGIKTFSNAPSYIKAAQDKIADLDEKLREVNREIEKAHTSIINMNRSASQPRNK